MKSKKIIFASAALFVLAGLAFAEAATKFKMDSLAEMKKIAAQNNLKEIRSQDNDYLAMSEDSKSFVIYKAENYDRMGGVISYACIDQTVHSRMEIIVRNGYGLKYILDDGEKICSVVSETSGDSIEMSENILLYYAATCIYYKCLRLKDIEAADGIILPEAAKLNDANFEKTYKKSKRALKRLNVEKMKALIESDFIF